MAEQIRWTHNVSAIVITQVPLQSMDTATALVNAYLSNHGGWDDGEGQPANGFTEQQTADAITEEQYDTIYDLNVHCMVVLNIQMAAKLTAGLNIDAALLAMQSQIDEFLTAQFNNSDIPINLNSIELRVKVAERSNLGVDTPPDQTTTQSVRQSIAADLAGPDKLFDYKANGLLYARNTYGLDDTWNVNSVYTKPNEPVVLQIKKYTTNTYSALDEGSTAVYVLTISPDTYGIVSGIILN